MSIPPESELCAVCNCVHGKKIIYNDILMDMKKCKSLWDFFGPEGPRNQNQWEQYCTNVNQVCAKRKLTELHTVKNERKRMRCYYNPRCFLAYKLRVSKGRITGMLIFSLCYNLFVFLTLHTQ